MSDSSSHRCLFGLPETEQIEFAGPWNAIIRYLRIYFTHSRHGLSSSTAPIRGSSSPAKDIIWPALCNSFLKPVVFLASYVLNCTICHEDMSPSSPLADHDKLWRLLCSLKNIYIARPASDRMVRRGHSCQRVISSHQWIYIHTNGPG